MSSRLTPEHRAAAARVAALVEKAIKSVGDVLDEFELEASQIVVDVFNAEASAGELVRSISTFVKVYGRMAYTEGMKEGGIDDPEAEISDADEAAIDAWVSQQLGFVDGFAADAAATRKADDRPAAQASILRRLQMWIASLRDIGSQGKASALKNMMVTWVYGDTVEHCATCSKLEGKRHRLSWFMDRGYLPQQNGSETLECGGWNCLCTLVDDGGKVVYPA